MTEVSLDVCRLLKKHRSSPHFFVTERYIVSRKNGKLKLQWMCYTTRFTVCCHCIRMMNLPQPLPTEIPTTEVDEMRYCKKIWTETMGKVFGTGPFIWNSVACLFCSILRLVIFSTAFSGSYRLYIRDDGNEVYHYGLLSPYEKNGRRGGSSGGEEYEVSIVPAYANEI
jgi:hypothetical protein